MSIEATDTPAGHGMCYRVLLICPSSYRLNFNVQRGFRNEIVRDLASGAARAGSRTEFVPESRVGVTLAVVARCPGHDFRKREL
jgi:hypothetical protein